MEYLIYENIFTQLKKALYKCWGKKNRAYEKI